jgi:hypothetical protein
MFDEERRKLIIGDILSMGLEAVKFLPKEVLKDGDLKYLPLD